MANGSSGLGALNKACIDNKTVLICKAGLHLSEKKKSPYSESIKKGIMDTIALKSMVWFKIGCVSIVS